ncbi:coproporphyrinogen III oxidase [Sphingobium indicum IP26]|uniref:radical SAM protein n=1 Tax=Sphingobium sp. HDIP04 TaxID=428994 RepID=UPI00038114DA|nr:radical SAM protein [Sphingobium sp. HDIP04]EPR15087.1 coproporphyrinogen III oxidase [Sphingobium indicum IP26]EPR15176.1 coproporphyrinogen III oxidase [Sphingobium indicum IP26]EPR17425.1 coproporphyrinogen III oxidase [Sphingobium indicum IP26]EQB08888.1 coproporphyrinogen III oxidase [Sphingobium sp. HDIP04]
MWTYHPDLLDRPVPRYTSYPTAAQFGGDVGAAELAARLDAVAGVKRDDALSLYVHIPYCHDICWYCGCNTGAANRVQRLAAYVESLEREIATLAARLNGRGRVRRIAFGGGSPNSLPLVDFVRLLQQLLLCFEAHHAELSVELDPRRLDGQWISTMAAMGVDRVNLGVQTFTPHVQARIGRIQPLDMVERAVGQLRAAGIATGFDLMYGLPGQTQDDLAATLEAAIAMRPARIALFGYAHMPRLLPRQRRIDAGDLPDLAARFAMAARGHETLTGAGYEAIGFDHFALPEDAMARAAREGRLRRNFQGFTDDPADILLGLGASAISQFPDLIVQNEKQAGPWRGMADAGRLTAARGTLRTPEDRRRGRIIEALLCQGEAHVGTAHPMPDLRRFERLGLVRLSEGRVALTRDALPYARSIAACFDAYMEPTERRFSHAV